MRRPAACVAGLAVALAFAATLDAPASTRQAPAATTIVVVDADQPLRPLNHHLVGFGWHEGGAPLETIAPLDPHLVRIDASLQDVSTGPGEPLRLDGLLDKVATARSVGGEPLVILSYLPAWLGEPAAFGRDPTRVRPADLDAWQLVVHDVVLALATAPQPALRFEAWNEPDIPLFWQDTPLAWVDTVERSARAVAAVEQETGLDLRFGGPATAVPDPIYLTPFLARFRDPALPLDFVSWHYYGNYPFFGPDGAEFPVTEPIQPLLGRPNPIASPAVYAPQVDFVRELTEVGLAGSGRSLPALVLDEWNLSAAGFDLRHDGPDGAAFAVGVLAELQSAGAGEAAFFRANDTRGVPGEHGAVTLDGTPKPVWWAFELWQRLAATQVVVTGADEPFDDLWAVATVEDGRVAILLASFSASPDGQAPRTVDIRLSGLADVPAAATVRRIDGQHISAEAIETIALDGAAVSIPLPVQAVALVEISPSSSSRTAPGGGPAPGGSVAAVESPAVLPATGASGTHLPTATLFAAGALVLRAGWRGSSRPRAAVLRRPPGSRRS